MSRPDLLDEDLLDFSPNRSLIDASQTLVRPNIAVPPGHVLAHRKWQNSDVVRKLKAKVGVVFDDRLGVVDFHLSAKLTALYLTEGDVLVSAVMQRRIAKFRKGLQETSVTGFVIIEKTHLTRDAFKDAQDLAVIQLGLPMHPVKDAEAVADLIVTCLRGLKNDAGSNPLNVPVQPSVPVDQSILKALTSIPGVGNKSAKLILSKFGSLQNIASASHQEMVQTVGENLAVKIRNFLDA